MNVLCFGEILYDCIGEEKKLGGAPLNVAGHIAQMGGKVAVVSAVGKDEDGINAINEMERLNVSSEFVEKREEGTGKAIVVLSDGIPDYSFTEPSAWDYIEESKLDKEALLTSSFDAFVFGTLASRREISRRSLFWILDNLSFRDILFDINIRKNFYSKPLFEKAMEKTTILKMNDEELPLFCSMFSLEKRLSSIMEAFPNLKAVVMTKGGDGLDFITRDDNGSIPAIKSNVIDTVGAGDSISASLLDGLSRGLELREALKRALILSSYVVGKRGAIPIYDDEIKSRLGL